MSIRKRVARNRDGEVTLTVKVTGVSDIFRFATSMLGMRTEFADTGRKTLRSLREAIGRDQYLEVDHFVHGRHLLSRGSGPKVAWFVLRGGTVRHAAQGNRFIASARVEALCGRSGLPRVRVEPDSPFAFRPCPVCAPKAEALEQMP